MYLGDIILLLSITDIKHENTGSAYYLVGGCLAQKKLDSQHSFFLDQLEETSKTQDDSPEIKSNQADPLE